MTEDAFPFERAVGRMQVKIPVCASCGKEHDPVEVHSMQSPQPPFSHWYMCPENMDPVPMALLVCDDKTVVAVHNQILQRVVRCLLAKRYMMAFWRVDNGTLVCDSPVYVDFPNGDFGPALGHLYDLLRKALGVDSLSVPISNGLSQLNVEALKAPMPVVNPATLPKVNLFGDN